MMNRETLTRMVYDIMLSAVEAKSKHTNLTGRELEVMQTKMIDNIVEAVKVERGNATKFPTQVATIRKHFRDEGVNDAERMMILGKIQEWNHEHESEYDPETLLDR